MKKLLGYLVLGISLFTFIGCSLYEEPKVKEEPCNKMPEDLSAKLDEYIKKYYNDDSYYFKARQLKASWEKIWKGNMYESRSKKQKEECAILKESWEYAKNKEYTVFQEHVTCLELPFLITRKCLNEFDRRYDRLYKQRITDVFGY